MSTAKGHSGVKSLFDGYPVSQESFDVANHPNVDHTK